MIIVPCTFNSLWRDLWWNFVFFAFFGIGYVLQKERIKILSWHSLVLITVLSILPIRLLHSMLWNLDEKLVKFFKNKLYVRLVVNGTVIIIKLSAILKCHVMSQNIGGSVWEKIIINNYSKKWRGILVLVHTQQKTKY